MACLGIEEAKTGKPVLIDLDFGDGEKPGEVSYFFHGTNILDIYLKKDEVPRYRFIFHGPGKSEVWWLNLAGGEPSFTERISYDTNGNRSNFAGLGMLGHGIRLTGETSIMVWSLTEQWHRLAFDTNGAWTIDATNHF